MKNIIELKNVTKRFGGITALNKASLHVNVGEVVGLIGDNGAGKSTLIKTLVGVYAPDEGEIKIRPVMYLALSYDHRIIDGKDSVSFLKLVKENLEDPRKLFLDL